MTLWRRKPVSASPAESGPSLFIEDLISKVHDELLQARRKREQRGDPAIFEVSDMTLEVHFVAQRDTDYSGGIDLKIVTVGGVNAGAARHYSDQQIHKITLNLTAVPYGAGWDGHAGRHGRAGSPDEDEPIDLDVAPRFRPNEE
jgi:Trypsin-co-occurring domain 2